VTVRDDFRRASVRVSGFGMSQYFTEFNREFSFAARTVMDESMITEERYTVGTEVVTFLVLAAR
jgi:hypothetical protein